MTRAGRARVCCVIIRRRRRPFVRCLRKGRAARTRGDGDRRRAGRRTTTEHGRDEGDDQGFLGTRRGDVTWRARRARVRVASSSVIVVVVGRSVSSERTCGSRVRRDGDGRGGGQRIEHGRDEGDDQGFQRAHAGNVTWRAWRARARVAPSFVVVVVGRSVSSERMCGSRCDGTAAVWEDDDDGARS